MKIDRQHVHFVGVGGIGMSAIALMAGECGASVSGCDVSDGPTMRTLAARDFRVSVGHDPAHLEGVALVVRSSAVSEDHPEIRAARERGIPVIGRARMLARLANGHRVVGIAGTHGKTTTTWIVASLLLEARYDPSVMVGGMVGELGGNYRVGAGQYMVTEVDESDGSLLEFQPYVSVVTNVELEHVDRYPDLGAVQETFREYLRGTQPDGCAVVCADCPAAMETLSGSSKRSRTYGFQPGAEVRGRNLRLEGTRSRMDVERPSGPLDGLEVGLPGRHNAQNALAAVAVADELGIGDEPLRRALGQLVGVDRRLQVKGCVSGVRVVDDYAHHPTEIAATLAAMRQMVDGRLIGAFQPHRYSRTQQLGDKFGACFDKLDRLVILPIYGAGEEPIDGVTSQIVVDAVEERGNVPYTLCGSIAEAVEYVRGALAPGDTLITLGAGNVYQVGDALLAGREECAVS
jgi:UDP-N-acetylmuramate--alanine ligase